MLYVMGNVYKHLVMNLDYEAFAANSTHISMVSGTNRLTPN